MSPEQATGETLDGRTDLFSLGVVLYECATGRHPFTGKTTAVVLSAILNRAPVAPIVLNPELPPHLEDIIQNCLEKDRELRYQSAADLRADLRRLRRDLESGHSRTVEIAAVRSSTMPRAGRTAPGAASRAAEAPRRQGRTAAAIAGFFLLAAVAAALLWRGPTADLPQPPSPVTERVSPPAGPQTPAAVPSTDAAAAAPRTAPTRSVETAVTPPAPTRRSEPPPQAPRTPAPAAPRPSSSAAAASGGSPAPPPDRLPVVGGSPFVPVPSKPVLPGAPPAPAAQPAPASASTSGRNASAPAPAPAPAAEEKSAGARSGPAPPDDDDAAIRRVIATYARAIENKDLALFRSVKPNLSREEQRRLEEGFRAVTRQRVALTIVSIDRKGQQAVVALRRIDTIEAGGRRQTVEGQQTFTLDRGGAGWTISEIR